MYHIFLAYFSGLFLREYSSNSYGQTYGTFTYLHQLDPEIPVPAGWLLFRVYYPSTTCFFLDFVDHHGIHLCGGWFSYFFWGWFFIMLNYKTSKRPKDVGPKSLPLRCLIRNGWEPWVAEFSQALRLTSCGMMVFVWWEIIPTICYPAW